MLAEGTPAIPLDRRRLSVLKMGTFSCFRRRRQKQENVPIFRAQGARNAHLTAFLQWRQDDTAEADFALGDTPTPDNYR